ncbi:hypothetical protein FRC05_000743 [Tulasnella sp. 425]|nr:hypothetical protein FRC05_000743 [Tulasnella sp. 425]
MIAITYPFDRVYPRTWLTAERIIKTSIGAFDQLTIISQRAISGQLANMWQNTKSILRKIDVKPSPTTLLSISTLQPSNFSSGRTSKRSSPTSISRRSGKFGYYDGSAPGAEPKTEQLGLSRLALRVNMAFDQLDSNNQLLFDFTTADLISPTNGVDKSEFQFDISEEAKTSFCMLIEAYLAVLRKKDEDGNPAEQSIIRYTATARRPNVFTATPTCAPTTLSFQNLPFVVKDGDEVSLEPVLEGKDTMLVYLQMTHKMPNTLYQDSQTSNSLTIPEGLDLSGKHVLKLSGSTLVETYLHLDGIGDIEKTTCSVRGSWDANLILDGVNDGALQITVDSPRTSTFTSDIESFAYSHILDETVAACQAMFKDSQLHDIKAALDGLFGGPWSFHSRKLKYKSVGSGDPAQPE